MPRRFMREPPVASDLAAIEEPQEPHDDLAFTFGIPAGLDLITLLPAEKEYDYAAAFRACRMIERAWMFYAHDALGAGITFDKVEDLELIGKYSAERLRPPFCLRFTLKGPFYTAAGVPYSRLIYRDGAFKCRAGSAEFDLADLLRTYEVLRKEYQV